MRKRTSTSQMGCLGEGPTCKDDLTATPGSLSLACPSGAAVCAWKVGPAWPVPASICHTALVAPRWDLGEAAVGAAGRERHEPMRPITDERTSSPGARSERRWRSPRPFQRVVQYGERPWERRQGLVGDPVALGSQTASPQVRVARAQGPRLQGHCHDVPHPHKWSQVS